MVRGRLDTYKIVVGAGAMLPTSETSQNSSLRFSAIGKLHFIKEIKRYHVKLLFLNYLYLNSHKFETANKAGTYYNSQTDLVNGIRNDF